MPESMRLLTRNLPLAAILFAAGTMQADGAVSEPEAQAAGAAVVDYFERMCAPKPFVVRQGDTFVRH